MTDEQKQKDFFVSYTGSDESWATWVAWQLEQAGFTTVIQAWDFRPGSNFILEMQRASTEADRTIMILSSNYPKSHFAAPEWAAAFALDPEGYKRRLVPVRVEDCEVVGLLKQLIYIDLVGLASDAAAAKLLAGVSPGRAKPQSAPQFPGLSPKLTSLAEVGMMQLPWRAVEVDAPVLWSHGLRLERVGSYSGAKLEVQLLPVQPVRVEMRHLRSVQNELTTIGRRSGLFSATEEVDSASVADVTYARSGGSREFNANGLIVGRNGQRGAWLSLPRDVMGSVLDVSAMKMRVAAMLRTLMSIEIVACDDYAIAASLGPTTLLTVGSEDVLGRRSQASMGMGVRSVEVAPDDALPAASFSVHAEDVAEELLSRIVAQLETL